jgi:hypothetical protein
MTKNGFDIQTISTKLTDIQTGRVLLFGQLTDIIEKVNSSHFLKFHFNSHIKGTFAFASLQETNTSQKQKSRFIAPPKKDSELNTQPPLKNEFL